MRLPGTLVALSVAALAVVLAGTPRARADEYPSRPVHLLVGFIPGSAADLAARVLANGMSPRLGQQIVVENKPGAGSSVAADVAAHAAKDGYTLFLGSSANITNAAINPHLSFDMGRDFAPIALVTAIPVVLVVNPDLGVKSVPELIALAKAKPGGLLYGSTGVGTAPHLAAELFGMRIGAKLVHVPYQGSPQAVTDLIAGRTALMFSPASTVLPQIEAGKLRALATAASKRPKSLPDLPTMEEAGIADFDTSIWFGLMAPAGTPADIVARLARATAATVGAPDVSRTLQTQGFEPLAGGPEEFVRYLAGETAKWKHVAEAAGLTQ